MKRTSLTPLRASRVAGAALVIAAISAFLIIATGSHAALAGHGQAMAGHQGKGHAEHFARVAAALDLSEQQKAAARQLHDETAARAAPLREQARLQHEEIEAMLESGTADPTELGERMIAAYGTHKRLGALHDQTMSKLKAQLSPEQRAKLEKLQKEHGHAAGEHAHFLGAPLSPSLR